MELIDSSELCPRCFTKKYNTHTNYCYECSTKHPLFTKSASACEYLGVAATVIKKLKYHDMPYLAKGAAAAMFAQMYLLKWPLPDIIVPVPLALSHKMRRGYNQSELIGKELCRMTGCPMTNALMRKKGGYSQASLRRHQREQMPLNTFELKKGTDFHEKRVLLVDDVYTTGSTLRRCGEALCEGYPREIYGLTFCRAI